MGQKITTSISRIGSHGEGIGDIDGYTLFIENALPEEVVEAELSELHKTYGRAKLLDVKIPSKERIPPPCPLFERCGGCQLMHLNYPKQLELKRQKVVDALERIGKLKNIPVDPCRASPLQLGYRNKIQLPVLPKAGQLSIGLYERSSHNLVEVESCLIHSATGEKAYTRVKELVIASGIEAYSPDRQTGELRHILIKSALFTQEVLIILVTKGSASPQIKELAHKIYHSLKPLVKGVVHNSNRKRTGTILGAEYTLLEGQDFIVEELSGLFFKVSPASFFQVNPHQALALYEKALELAALNGSETVLDAYCGVGTLSLLFARQAKEVIGIECVEEAIKNAQENASLNKISNASFFCHDAADFFTQSRQKIDVALLNPPRKGASSSFLQGLKEWGIPTLIYISCDPATLARDLAILASFGYTIEQVHPFDMFPQTAHVECCVKLTLRGTPSTPS